LTSHHRRCGRNFRSARILAPSGNGSKAWKSCWSGLFVIPGINKPVGLDVILDIIPGVGTISAAALGSYIAWEARNLGMTKWQIARMAGNIGFDMLLARSPGSGAIPDLFFQSNTRNLRIIKRHLDKHHPHTRTIDVEAR
jgi:hypothetical protein